MDLQTVKSQYGAHWAWARTGALILFLVSALLLAMSLNAARSEPTKTASPTAGTRLSSLLFHSPTI
jgi:hypothetical protein